MKKLLLSLMVFATLASCGKDNKVASAAAPAPATTTTSPITTTVAGAAELGTKIDQFNTQFGIGQLYYYGNVQTWGTLANTGLNLVYKYTKSTATSTGSGSNCEKKWGIFYVCSYSNTSTSVSNVTESRRVYNNQVDVTGKINELKAIINNVNPLIPIQTQGYSYRIQTRDGKQYILDTRYPIQAQPIGVMDSTGTEYLYNITEN